MTKNKEQRDRYAKETYQFRKSRGYCVKCGKNRAFHNHVMCPECIEKDSLRSANRTETEEQKERRNQVRLETYHKRKESGVCVRCGRKEATVGTKCLECYAKHKRVKDEWRNRNLVKGYADSGLCIRCGNEPETGRNLCVECLEKSRKQMEYARGFIPRQLRIENF